MPTNSSSWSKHILIPEYKCHSLSCIKMTFELHSTLITKKRIHEKYIPPFLVQHLRTFLLQQQFRAHLESWWTPLHSAAQNVPPVCRMPCLGCGYPSITFQCTIHQKLANSAPANQNLCSSGQRKSETEMPLTVENNTWSRITTASWMQPPGTLKYELFPFHFPSSRTSTGIRPHI